MDLHTTAFERALHLLLFVAGGVAVAVTGLAALERLTDAAKRTIRLLHLVLAVGLFALLFVGERIYHSIH